MRVTENTLFQLNILFGYLLRSVVRLFDRELHKATHNFTALLGQGAFGPVYKAILPSTGTTLAVKVLAEQSKQGDREFQNEVLCFFQLSTL